MKAVAELLKAPRFAVDGQLMAIGYTPEDPEDSWLTGAMKLGGNYSDNLDTVLMPLPPTFVYPDRFYTVSSGSDGVIYGFLGGLWYPFLGEYGIKITAGYMDDYNALQIEMQTDAYLDDFGAWSRNITTAFPVSSPPHLQLQLGASVGLTSLYQGRGTWNIKMRSHGYRGLVSDWSETITIQVT